MTNRTLLLVTLGILILVSVKLWLVAYQFHLWREFWVSETHVVVCAVAVIALLWNPHVPPNRDDKV